jgi:protein-L-isoaspartate O-methyltransferase
MSGRIPGFFQGTEMPDAGWWEALWPNPAGVLSAVGVTPGMVVVDLCSGDGWFTLQIAKVARHVIAIDIDPLLSDVASRRLSERSLTNCDFVVGDAYELPALVPYPADFVFMANAFCRVVCNAALLHSLWSSGGVACAVARRHQKGWQNQRCGRPRRSRKSRL